MVQAMLPANSTLEQTDMVMKDVRDYFLEREKDAVESCMTASGIGFSGRGQNTGMSFVKLKDWKLRDRPDLKVGAVAGRAMKEFSKIPQRHGVCLCASSRHRAWHGQGF